MATRFPEIFAALAAPFDSAEVKRRNQGGRQLSYITMRTAVNRIDKVLGPENHKPEYTETEKGIRCRLWYRLDPDGEWLWKEDGGAQAGMPEADNDEKSGYSDAFKRAAVGLGVGRYLYQDGVPNYSDADPAPIERAIESNGFVRQPEPSQPPPAPSAPPATVQGRDIFGNLPRAGRQMYPWMKEMEAKYGVGIVKYMTDWSKVNGFPYKSSEWDDEQTRIGVAEACRKLTDGASPPVQAADRSAPSTGDMPANFQPDGSIEKPGQGRFLYKLAKEAEEKHGCTFVQPLNAWGKATGRPDKLVEWTGQDLEDGWRYLCWKVQSLAGPVATPAPSANGDDLGPLKRQVMAKGLEHWKIIHPGQADPGTAIIKTTVERLFREVCPGVELSTAGPSQLGLLVRTLAELIVEADGIPF